MNKVLVILKDDLLRIIDMLLSDYDDDLMKNMWIDLDFSRNDRLLDDIEWNLVVVECNHHVLRNVILDDWIFERDDQRNDLTVKIVFGEKDWLLRI